MRLSGWTLIFPSQKSHSDRLLGWEGDLSAPSMYSSIISVSNPLGWEGDEELKYRQMIAQGSF